MAERIVGVVLVTSKTRGDQEFVDRDCLRQGLQSLLSQSICLAVLVLDGFCRVWQRLAVLANEKEDFLLLDTSRGLLALI